MINWLQLTILFITGLAAGFVDSIAGGGGMITLPVMMSLGLPPQTALGTNKLQATFGSGSAAVHYTRAGAASWRENMVAFVYTFFGSLVGTMAVRQLSPAFLRVSIPVLLISLAIYMLAQPQLGHKDVRPRMTRDAFNIAAGLGLGFYDGFFGPGAGTFWTMAFMMGLGFNMVRATGATKVVNFSSNLASLLIFSVAGQVALLPGLAMGTGQLVGARIGAGLVMAGGKRFVRPIFLVMVLAIAARLLWTSLR